MRTIVNNLDIAAIFMGRILMSVIVFLILRRIFILSYNILLFFISLFSKDAATFVQDLFLFPFYRIRLNMIRNDKRALIDIRSKYEDTTRQNYFARNFFVPKLDELLQEFRIKEISDGRFRYEREEELKVLTCREDKDFKFIRLKVTYEDFFEDIEEYVDIEVPNNMSQTEEDKFIDSVIIREYGIYKTYQRRDN